MTQHGGRNPKKEGHPGFRHAYVCSPVHIFTPMFKPAAPTDGHRILHQMDVPKNSTKLLPGPQRPLFCIFWGSSQFVCRMYCANPRQGVPRAMVSGPGISQRKTAGPSWLTFEPLLRTVNLNIANAGGAEKFKVLKNSQKTAKSLR